MKIVINALLIAILLLGFHLNEGLAGEHIFSDLFIEKKLGALNRGEDTKGLDPYFSDSEKITKQAEDHCRDYFGDKNVMGKDLFCGCSGRETAALVRNQGQWRTAEYDGLATIPMATFTTDPMRAKVRFIDFNNPIK